MKNYHIVLMVPVHKVVRATDMQTAQNMATRLVKDSAVAKYLPSPFVHSVTSEEDLFEGTEPEPPSAA